MKQQEGISLPPRSGKLLNLYQGAVDRAQALQARLGEMERELEAVKRERDAAIKDLSNGLRCNACKKFFKNNKNVGCSGGLYCIPFRFEWRGVCPENMEVKEDE